MGASEQLIARHRIVRFGLAMTLALLSGCSPKGNSANRPRLGGPSATVAVPKAGLANPASVYCVEKGGRVNIITGPDGGQVGMCVFPDGSEIEEWAYMRGQGEPAMPLTLDMLKNATYPSQLASGRVITLTDGRYEEVLVPGSASKLIAALHPSYTLGDLNGDGVADAVVFIVESGGGSGSFYSLIAVVNQAGRPRALASTSLGDRIKVERVSITAGEIVADLVTHGPQEPMCCPTLKATKRFKLEGEKLVPIA